MENKFVSVNGESKSIITAEQASREIKKTQALPPLSDQNMARAGELAMSLVRSEDRLDDIVMFGNDVLAAMEPVSKAMLAGVRVGALDDVIQLSDGVLAQINTLDIADLSPVPRRVLLGITETIKQVEARVRNFFRKYELVNTLLDRQEADIFARETASTERYYKDTELAKTAFATILDAQVKLMAIKMFLESEHGYTELERRNEAVEADRQAAEREYRSTDYAIIVAGDLYARYITHLETKATALQQVILSMYQGIIATRMMGNNELIIRQKLNDIRTFLLPQWRMLIAIAYQAYQQQGIAKFVQQLQRTETELRKQVGDQIVLSAEGVADIMTRQLFTVEAMQYTNEKLVSSLDILKTASIEAKKIRETAEAEMQVLINQVTDAVAATSTRTI